MDTGRWYAATIAVAVLTSIAANVNTVSRVTLWFQQSATLWGKKLSFLFKFLVHLLGFKSAFYLNEQKYIFQANLFCFGEKTFKIQLTTTLDVLL